MDNVEEIIEKLNYYESEVKEIKEMIKALLVNSIIDECNLQDIMENIVINKSIENILIKYNLDIDRCNIINGHKILYIKIMGKINIKEILVVKNTFLEYLPSTEVVFEFNTLNGMQKKSLLQRKISYSVIDKELHIFSLK